jgi:hypothetical protein
MEERLNRAPLLLGASARLTVETRARRVRDAVDVSVGHSLDGRSRPVYGTSEPSSASPLPVASNYGQAREQTGADNHR